MLDELFESIGYNDEELSFIKKSYPINTVSESTLYFNFKNIIKFLRNNGFSNSDIVRITTLTPQIIMMSVENLKIKINEITFFEFNKIEILNMIKRYPYILFIPEQTIKEKYLVFKELSFPSSFINCILLNKPDILNLKSSSIKKRFNYFEEYGYRCKDIIKIFKEVPYLIDADLDYIHNNMSYLSDMGFSKKDIIKISSCFPELFNYDKNELENKLKVFIEYRFTQNDIVTIIKKIPIIFQSNYLELVNDKFAFLIKCGFSTDEIIIITKFNPYIILYSCDLLQDVLNCFTKFYRKSDILKMIMNCPYIFGYSSKNIYEKLNYYKEIGLIDYIKFNSNYLLLSLDFIKARYSFIDKNVLSDLFIDDSAFIIKYNVSRDEIIERMV